MGQYAGKFSKLQEVVKRREIADGTYLDTLKCGHVYVFSWNHVKAKVPYPKQRRCYVCENLAPRGGRGRPFIQMPPPAELMALIKQPVWRGKVQRPRGVAATARLLRCTKQTIYNRLKKGVDTK